MWRNAIVLTLSTALAGCVSEHDYVMDRGLAEEVLRRPRSERGDRSVRGARVEDQGAVMLDAAALDRIAPLPDGRKVRATFRKRNDLAIAGLIVLTLGVGLLAAGGAEYYKGEHPAPCGPDNFLCLNGLGDTVAALVLLPVGGTISLTGLILAGAGATTRPEQTTRLLELEAPPPAPVARPRRSRTSRRCASPSDQPSPTPSRAKCADQTAISDGVRCENTSR
jgi:hypothetical protein